MASYQEIGGEGRAQLPPLHSPRPSYWSIINQWVSGGELIQFLDLDLLFIILIVHPKAERR